MTSPKKIINDPNNAVSELINGLLYQYPNTLKKLANHNVLLSSSISHTKVNILSGGGSGHEPSHAGYIGNGMLTGAILGGIFASPSVSSILAAIRAVSRITKTMSTKENKGCLLIVKNYTGDRLNFGMACELANAEGRKCKMVVVADDCAIPRTKGVTGARGVCGTVLVHKIAGAAAAKGMDLDYVAALANEAASRIGSLGVALDAVTIPGASSINNRLDEKTIEIGMGIHGEAGINQSSLLSSDELARVMITTILEYGRIEHSKSKIKSMLKKKESTVPTFEKGDNLMVVVNNLGGASNFEMSILANSVVKFLEGGEMGKCSISRLCVGSFMTSFNMYGVSISILSLTDANKSMSLIELLDYKTNAPAWKDVDAWDFQNGIRDSQTEIPEVPQPPHDISISYEHVQLIGIDSFSELATAAVSDACNVLINSESVLTKYDLITGDGDCGITMERGAKEIIERIKIGTINTSHPVPFFSTLSDAISSSMGGTSGVLLEIMFRKMSIFLNSKVEVGYKTLVDAFEEGVNAVSFYGNASVGSRTMLDALVPAFEALSEGTLVDAARAAINGSAKTATMATASAGRSNYLSQDTLIGTPDPGAFAVGLVLGAIAKL